MVFSTILALTHCSGTPRETLSVYNDQWSAARNWNEALLAAIRVDLARPTVHARNLFHTSAMMYDLWAVYDKKASTYFLGKTRAGTTCKFTSDDRRTIRTGTNDLPRDRATALSYAMYSLLNHRFAGSPGKSLSQAYFLNLLLEQGHNPFFASRNYLQQGAQLRAAALGLYLADCVIAFGLNDGSGEQNGYVNQIYEPVNDPLEPHSFSTPGMNDPDRWQPLSLLQFIDQSGHQEISEPEFTSAEWGWVEPFALTTDDRTTISRDGVDWPVYHDPGPPARLAGEGTSPDNYRWAHSIVVYWSAQLDPDDGVMWDISPGVSGNTAALPETLDDLQDFYNAFSGGINVNGHHENPVTGEPYEANLVPRGDFARVLAEFWADGPDSETPPGHWFTIFNKAVSDHPDITNHRRYKGDGPLLGSLEWDVKAYFALGGAVHDAAITAWSIKAAYDYVRPISAIRYMASLGQSTDSSAANYHPDGIPLVEGYVESIESGDPLAGSLDENLGKIKVRTWRGPDAVNTSDTGYAGVDWILAGNWWPYQRPTFVSPPFAGYVSGHSTFSRAAAEVLTAFTGSEYFPGGIGEFHAEKDRFLIFEAGPSVDVTLQWATYFDAADQSGLSRIWGGIHPPVDDVPGRRLGIPVGRNAFTLADRYFNGEME